MRHTKMAEWMENVEKAISRIMADKVYTSAEFKRERDNFHVSKTNNWNVILAIINEIRGWSHSHAKAKIFEQLIYPVFAYFRTLINTAFFSRLTH